MTPGQPAEPERKTAFLHWMTGPHVEGDFRAVGENGTYSITKTENTWICFFQPFKQQIEHGVHESLFVVMEVCERHALAEANK